MTKFNIIQRRELEPLMLKANSIVKHYEIASNCCAYATGPDLDFNTNYCEPLCSLCNEEKCAAKASCADLHMEAISKARKLGGSYIYVCLKGLVFWTSPFYSGERFAGALFSGGVKKTEKNSGRVKALAQIMLLCANQITETGKINRNHVPKNIISKLGAVKTSAASENSKQEINHFDSSESNHASPLDMERMLLASLRRGDKTEGQKILIKLLKTLYQEVNNSFPSFRLKAIELAVLLSRAASDPKDIKDNTALETTERYLQKIEESSNFNEITDILTSITERMSDMIFSFHGVRHFSALRKAERYIWSHYTRKLSLKEIADASGLSAPYFSTVFKEEMGENLSNYLNRLRIEKAAAMLITTDLPISEVAVACGFEDQSWFSKIFKNNTSLTPGKYRERGMNA
ncbi:MAG: helix-turn-helix domain-containing protein, partial [Treponema sp.]|nr:helix-turn-helix domain-containing protein [Treponema sp.]MCL2252054.1 helix-turn-helix domain-containing protein [Treponema sp.]